VVGPGYLPGSDRRAAKALRKAAARRLAEARRAEAGARRAAARAERQAAAATPALPPRGEAGPQALRALRPLRIAPHRATSEVVSVAYPFLAEEGLGTDGILVGQDAWSGAAFCYDPWVLYERGLLTNPNIFLAGQIGRGKSMLAKSLASRCVAFGRRVYVPGDPKGEWSVVAQALGGQVISLGVGRPSRLNPLDEGPRPAAFDDPTWRAQVAARRVGLLGALSEATLGRPLRAVERSALDAALSDADATSAAPVLPQVVDALFSPASAGRAASVAERKEDGRELAHGLSRLVHGDLAGLFDGPSTVCFDPSRPVVSLDLSGVQGSELLLGLVMTCAGAWMEAVLADPGGGQRLVVYDEAWRLLAQPSLLARMQAHWKLSRAWGISNLLVVHRLSDLDAVGDAGSEARGLAQGLLADTATRIFYTEPYDEAEVAKKVLGLSSVEVAQLPELARGEGLWRVNERSFVVRHLVSDAELAWFSTDARMVGGPTRRPGGTEAQEP
jgi:hypothetical protein